MRLSEDLVGCASHTGHLEKRGQKNKDLKRRYFLLHGATLSYFESEDGAKKAKPKPKGQVGDRASTLMRTATMLKSNRLSVSGHRLSIAAGGAPKDRQSVVAEGGGGSPAARRGSVAGRTSVVAAGNAAGDQLQTTSL